MKIKIDENLPNSLVGILEDVGHGVSTVHDESLQGAMDAQIYTAVQEEQRALMTLDVGFADIRTYPPAEHAGIIVLRLEQQDKAHLESVTKRIAGMLTDEELIGKLWIVQEERIRIRS